MGLLRGNSKLKFQALGVWDLGSRVQGLEFEVSRSEEIVLTVEFEAQGLETEL